MLDLLNVSYLWQSAARMTVQGPQRTTGTGRLPKIALDDHRTTTAAAARTSAPDPLQPLDRSHLNGCFRGFNGRPRQCHSHRTAKLSLDRTRSSSKGQRLPRSMAPIAADRRERPEVVTEDFNRRNCACHHLPGCDRNDPLVIDVQRFVVPFY